MNPTHDIETQVAAIVAYLRAELGYDGESVGGLRRQLEENTTMIRTIDQTLRGQGDELGLVGWMMVLRRSWITMIALLGAALGYVMNDVMDSVNARAGGETPRLARTSEP
jgi:hypothetical protein